MMQDTVTDIIIDVILRSAPVERLHREAIVVPVPNIELLFEIREGQEGMAGVKTFVVLAVGTLDLAVVSRGKRLNEFVTDTEFLKGFLKQRGFILFRGEAAAEFGAIVCLDTLNREREGFDELSDELCGREGGFVFESGQIAETGVFINGGELVKPFAEELCIAGDAGDRDDLDIYLHTLAGIKHLLIRLRNVFGVRKFYRKCPQTLHNAPQAGDGAGIAPPCKFCPEMNEPVVRVPSAHVRNKLDLRGCVLAGMMMRTAGFWLKRFRCAVIPFPPSEERGPGNGEMPQGSLHTVFQEKQDNRLTIPNILCYYIHKQIAPPSYIFCGKLIIAHGSPICFFF